MFRSRMKESTDITVNGERYEAYETDITDLSGTAGMRSLLLHVIPAQSQGWGQLSAST